MAEKTVLVHLQRRSLLLDAMLEVKDMCYALQAFIHARDQTGEILSASRGMLARISDLAEAAVLAIDQGESSDPAPEEVVDTITRRRTLPSYHEERDYV